jgi:uncharacterized membrane protein
MMMMMVVVVMMVVLVVVMVMVLIPPPVIVILVVVVVMMVMMVVIVNELYIRIFGTALSTGSSCGRVCDPQKRGGIWNGIKQFSVGVRLRKRGLTRRHLNGLSSAE